MVEKTNTSLWLHIGSWIKKHKIIVGIVSAVVIVGVAATIFYITRKNPDPAPRNAAAKLDVVTLPEKFYSPLTGEEVKNELETKQPVTAIMIENSPDARPQSGIKQAGI